MWSGISRHLSFCGQIRKASVVTLYLNGHYSFKWFYVRKWTWRDSTYRKLVAFDSNRLNSEAFIMHNYLILVHQRSMLKINSQPILDTCITKKYFRHGICIKHLNQKCSIQSVWKKKHLLSLFISLVYNSLIKTCIIDIFFIKYVCSLLLTF